MQNDAQIAGLHALDVQASHLFGAVYGANAASINGGLTIWNLDDPARPEQMGSWHVPGAVGGDRSLEATQDGNYAVLATEAISCFGHVSADPFRVYLLDTSDKSRPVPVDVITAAGPRIGTPDRTSPSTGVHAVAVSRIDDQDYAFIFGKVFRIDRQETGARLVDTGASVPVGHDLYVRHTPWGEVWGLSANGGRNFQVFNLTDPEQPREIALFEGVDDRYLHTADVGFFDDEAVIVLSSEDWTEQVGRAWIFNATGLRDHSGDPVLLEERGNWTNPGGHLATGLSFSLHNPRFGDDGILTFSSYHGGLWQLDFRHPEFRYAPAEIGYAVYADGSQTQVEDPVFDTVESQLCGLGITLDAPTYMDVELGPDGILYAADVYMGLYTFTPGAQHPAYGTA